VVDGWPQEILDVQGVFLDESPADIAISSMPPFPARLVGMGLKHLIQPIT